MDVYIGFIPIHILNFLIRWMRFIFKFFIPIFFLSCYFISSMLTRMIPFNISFFARLFSFTFALYAFIVLFKFFFRFKLLSYFLLCVCVCKYFFCFADVTAIQHTLRPLIAGMDDRATKIFLLFAQKTTYYEAHRGLTYFPCNFQCMTSDYRIFILNVVGFVPRHGTFCIAKTLCKCIAWNLYSSLQWQKEKKNCKLKTQKKSLWLRWFLSYVFVGCCYCALQSWTC